MSLCNPPCDSTEQCSSEGECRPKPHLSTAPRAAKPAPKPARDDDDDDDDDKKQSVRPKNAYTTTNGRFYIGPKFALFSVAGTVYTMLGATLAVQASNIAASPFFVGARADLHRFTDGSGWLATLDLDLGFRFMAQLSKTGAVGIMLGGGVGFGGIFGNAPGLALFHMPLHIGPVFDTGAFTLQILLGPSLIYNKAALGLFESSIEFGARF